MTPEQIATAIRYYTAQIRDALASNQRSNIPIILQQLNDLAATIHKD